MNKLDAVFQSGKKNLLNMYCTAGYPQLESTAEVILYLQQHGADMVEIGMPYSDPIADGPVIQESNMTALKNGMNISLLLEQLDKIKEQVTIPVILMGYLNPVMQYGMERFCIAAKKAGVDALIIPDLPMYEYEQFYKQIITDLDMRFIFLITPETDKSRIKKADRLGNGFIYVVSSSSITGQSGNSLDMEFLGSLKTMHLRNPLMIGFGIKDKNTFVNACAYAAGAIIGSAYIKALGNSSDINATTKHFISGIRD